jgi:uncharacterized membrane protein YeaQ/YmgE (transglycosylase-associated protein family)
MHRSGCVPLVVGLWVSLVLLVMLALPLSAKTHIVYMGRGDSFEKEVYDKLLADFMTPNSDIEVEMQWVAGNAPEIYERLLITTAAGTPPDAFWAHTWSMGDLVSTHMLMPLDTFLAREQSDLRKEYYAASMDEFSRDGKTLGLPRESSTLVLFYNVDSFLQGGVAFIFGTISYIGVYGLLCLFHSPLAVLILFAVPVYPLIAIGATGLLNQHVAPGQRAEAMATFEGSAALALAGGSLFAGLGTDRLGLAALPFISLILAIVGAAITLLRVRELTRLAGKAVERYSATHRSESWFPRDQES